MNTLNLVLCFLVLAPRVFAQQQPLELHQDLTKTSLNSLLWYMDDAESRYTPEDFTNPEFQARFAPLDRKTPNFGLTHSALWARLTLRNTSDRPLTLYVTQGYSQVDLVSFWLLTPTGEKLANINAGDRTAKDPSMEPYRLPNIRLQLPPGDSVLLIRMLTEGSALLNVNAFSERELFHNKTVEYSFLCTMIGILLCMAIYNLFIWIQLRKPTHLAYVCFILTMVAQPLGYSGLLSHFTDNPWFMNEGFMMVSMASLACVFTFTMMFLSLRGRHPWLYRLCQFGLAVAVAFIPAALFSYNLGVKAALIISLLSSTTVLVCGIVCSWKRFRPAYFFTLAWLVMLVGNYYRIAMLAGHVPYAFGAEWGTVIGSVVEVMLLSLALADKVRITEKRAFAQIEALNTELTLEHANVVSLNLNLERLVEEQTREIKSILRHIQIGILVIKKQNLEITATHSTSVQNIFQTSDIAGRNAIELIFNHAEANQELASQVRSALNACLGEDAVNFDANCHLLPIELRYHFGAAEQLLQFDWNPVIDKEGRIEKFLLSVKDVTALKRLEMEGEEHSRELACIGEILEVSARQFGIFMGSAQRFLADNARLLKANLKAEREVLKILFINMHTIKGSARALGLKQLTPVIHGAEQNLAAVLHHTQAWDRDALLADNNRVQTLLDQYQSLNQLKLGRSSTDTVSFSMDFIERLRQLLILTETHGNTQLRMATKPIRESIEVVAFVRAEVIFREVLANAEMLARDLNKEFPVISIHDSGIQLSTEGQQLIRDSFIHIIRNSMDHGIETAQERVAKGKTAEGNISVKLEIVDQSLQIRYQDDGRGLNLRAIRQLATERGLIKRDQRLSLQEIAYLIFEPGFSTCEVTTDISGRGVGMSAVKEYMESEKGSVAISLHPGDKVVDPEFVPFEFIFRIGERYYISKAA